MVWAQAMATLQAMGFNVEECGVALDAAVGSSTHACVEHACELLVEAAEHKAEPAAHGAARRHAGDRRGAQPAAISSRSLSLPRPRRATTTSAMPTVA